MTTDKQLTVEEGNKIIAESPFGGCKIDKNEKIFKYVRERESWAWQGLKYHSSWDWLMPVIDKIDNLSYGNSLLYFVEIGRDTCFIKKNDWEQGVLIAKSEVGNRILTTWLAVIEFINWYNTNNQQLNKVNNEQGNKV